MITNELPPPKTDPPTDEFEDSGLEPEKFNNVDLESGTTQTAGIPPTRPPPASEMKGNNTTASFATASASGSASTANRHRMIIDSIASPFASMSFRDQIALLGVFSLVVLIQSSVNCSNGISAKGQPYPCTGENAYAVASGVISLFFCLLCLYGHNTGRLDDSSNLKVSLAFFLWWAPSMLVLTFKGPFNDVTYANGYFGTWGAFFVATTLLANTSIKFRESIDQMANGITRKPTFYLLIASIIEVGASIQYCIPQSTCYSYNALAITLGSVSGIICIILIAIIDHLSKRIVQNVALFFCMWWVIGGMLVTFQHPFTVMGNGYFAVFCAIISSFYILQSYETDSGTGV